MVWSAFILLAQNSNQFSQLLIAGPLILLAFYLILIRPQQRKDQEQRGLLSGLKKDDRVVTIGGIYGVVTHVRRDVDRITIKVDESNNTKIDVTVGAIARIISDDGGGEKATK